MNDTSTDLTKRQFGMLTVEDRIDTDRNPSKCRWVCRCSCGGSAKPAAGELLRGQVTSCGCTKWKNRLHDLTGEKFGKLKVKERSATVNRQTKWLCECDCGNLFVTYAASLTRGVATHCGCSRKPGMYKHGLADKPGYKKYLHSCPVKKLRHNASTLVRQTLKKIGKSKNRCSLFAFLPYTALDLKNHLESLWEPWMSWENYGGRNNDPRRTWHIDHIKPQSSFSFTSMEDADFRECWALNNLRPLEKIANLKKGKKCLF